MADPNTQTAELQSQLDEIQKERTQLRLSDALEPQSLEKVTLSEQVSYFWQHLMNEVMVADVQGYLPQIMPAAPVAPATVPQEAAEDEALPPPQPIMPSLIQRPPIPNGQYTMQMGTLIQPAFSWQNAPNADAKNGGSTTASQRYYKLIQLQSAWMKENIGLYGPAAVNTIQKIKQAESHAADGNLSTVHRILKSAKGSDPHNNTLCYLLSQVSYCLALDGNTDLLPEARAEAQKSANASENLPAYLLVQYRYDAAAIERATTNKKSTEWLREFYLLDVEPLTGPEGLGKQGGIYLKPWLLLGHSDPEVWGDYMFEAIYGLVTQVVGGAALYLHVLRPIVLEEARRRNVVPPGVEEIEEQIGRSYAAYATLARAFGSWQSVKEVHPWTVRNRFLTDFYNASKLPTFDEILMNTALNGRGYEANAHPVVNFQNYGYRNENYWRLWAIALAPEQAKKVNAMLPALETELEKKLYTEFEALLSNLVEVETGELDLAIMEETRPHMTTLTLDHLIAASNKKRDPRAEFMPTISPFSTLYRQWNEGAPAQVRPSEIITLAASQGGFGSAQEALAAINGAFALVKDKNYGLKPQQEAAKKVVARMKSGKRGFFSSNHQMPNVQLGAAPQVEMTISQMFMYVFIPISIISFIGILIYRLF